MKSTPIKPLIILVVSVLVQSCSNEAYMRTWSSSHEYDNRFTKIMVLGMINNVEIRNDIENELVFEARKAKLAATNGLSMFPPELGRPFEDVERFKTKLRDKGFDGILTTALIDVSEQRYIKPEVEYQPFGYYDRFGNYYFRTYDLVYRPGYFKRTSKYFIETNFYELSGGTLVWSGRSLMFEAQELNDFVSNYSRSLFKELFKEGIISK